MRTAARSALFALLAVAVLCAQNRANTNSQSTVPQTSNGSATNTNPNQKAAPATTQPGIPNGQSGSETNNASPSVARPAVSGGEIEAGREFRATLDTPLSSKTSRAGDRFTATVVQPVQGANAIVIPAGSRVEGEVSEDEEGKSLPAVKGRGKLNLRFRDIVLPTGQTVPLVATLVSVNSTNGKRMQAADNEGQIESGASGKNVARNVGIGAGVGSSGSVVFGSPLKGMAVGALAGGGYVLSTIGKDVHLPAETGMVLRLDQGFRTQ